MALRVGVSAVIVAALIGVTALVTNNRKDNKAAADAQVTYATSRLWVTGILVGCSALALLMAFVITRGITVPVSHAVAAANRLAEAIAVQVR